MSSSMTVQEFISGSLDLELTGMEFVDDVLLPHLEGGGYAGPSIDEIFTALKAFHALQDLDESLDDDDFPKPEGFETLNELDQWGWEFLRSGTLMSGKSPPGLQLEDLDLSSAYDYICGIFQATN